MYPHNHSYFRRNLKVPGPLTFEPTPIPQIQHEEHKIAPHPIGPTQKFRKDYAPPPYTISTVHLDFKLGEETTIVTSRMRMLPNYGQLAEGGWRVLRYHVRDDTRQDMLLCLPHHFSTLRVVGFGFASGLRWCIVVAAQA